MAGRQHSSAVVPFWISLVLNNNKMLVMMMRRRRRRRVETSSQGRATVVMAAWRSSHCGRFISPPSLQRSKRESLLSIHTSISFFSQSLNGNGGCLPTSGFHSSASNGRRWCWWLGKTAFCIDAMNEPSSSDCTTHTPPTDRFLEVPDSSISLSPFLFCFYL